MLTGRPGGYQLHYDGRGLFYEDWPAQRTLYGPDGTQAGDVKSHGFVPVPGSRHPNGSMLPDGAGQRRAGRRAAVGLPAYTEALLADQEGLGHHSGKLRPHHGQRPEQRAVRPEEDAVLRESCSTRTTPNCTGASTRPTTEFPDPLDEEEVRDTVLRIKGWRRHGHYNPEPMEHAPEEDVSAGSETLRQTEEPGPSGPPKEKRGGKVVKKSSALREAGPPKRLDPVHRVESEAAGRARQAPPVAATGGMLRKGTWELYEDLAATAIENLKADALLAQAEGT